MNAARRCRCGCGREVGVGRKYRPGHDRVHIERLAREYRGTTGVERDGVEIEATRTLTRPLFTEYLRLTGASK